MEVIREHFEECLKHFSTLFKRNFPNPSKNRRNHIRELAGFCNISPDTVKYWIDSGEHSPKGQPAIKLMCWLDLHGYKVIEFERMSLDRVTRNFAELIGFGFLTAEEAATLVGFSKTQNLYDVFWDRAGIGDEKKQMMWEFWKKNKDELERKKREVFETSSFKSLFEQPSQTILALPSSSEPVSKQRKAVIQIMNGLLGLLDENLFADLSEENVSEFDQSTLSNIGRLSVHLSTLSLKILQLKRGG